MQIHLNGAPRDLEPGATLAALIDELSLSGRRLAVEVNEEVVPRSRYPQTALSDGDRVEIVHAIGGG